jgi:DNA-binding transcriptional LysR family regulator
MVRDELSVLSAFLAVAEERSFTRAAKRLNVSKSGLSHAIRRLEDEIGVRLLARTTRSVSPTDAGEQLLASLRPALADIRGKLTQISGLQQRPVGRVRLLVPRLAAKAVVGPKLGQFVQNYPDVVLDITTDDSRVDLVAAGYDAGIQFGEYIAQDMVAVRVSPDIRPAVVASPGYFRAHGKPHTPSDLLRHRCINFRHRGEGVYRWELDRGGSVRSRRRERVADPRRPRSRDRGRDRRRRNRLHGRGSRAALSRERRTRTRARGLVAAVSWLLPLLPQSATATGGADGVDRDAAADSRGKASVTACAMASALHLHEGQRRPLRLLRRASRYLTGE